jgi:dTDP-4-amino-4,6-dideoxygalactose transaminase
VTSRTKAVIPVHLYGQPADMDPIMEFAARHGLVVIEDAAQAHGARYKGRMCGTLGHSAAFSFYPGKNLGAFSDGGAITTNDDEVARKARMLRNYGSEKRYHHDIAGMNSRLDELQAAFLRIKLRRLDEWNARRLAAADRYHQLLSNMNAPSALPVVPEWASPVWHLFVIRHPLRDLLQKHLEEHGVHTIIHYPIPPHLSQAYQTSAGPAFPVAEGLCGEILSLPMGPHLSMEHVGECAELVVSFAESRK